MCNNEFKYINIYVDYILTRMRYNRMFQIYLIYCDKKKTKQFDYLDWLVANA